MAAASAANAAISESATARCDALLLLLPADGQPGPLSSASISSSGVSQTVSASGIAARSAAVSGAPSSSVNANRPPGVEGTGDLAQQRLLVREREHRLQQQHDVEPAGRQRRDRDDLEAAWQVAGPLARDLDGRGARVHAQVGAAELAP